jgi:signal transduction histidine kinase
MTKKTRSLRLLITTSLLGIFLLQVYFGYQVYQKHRFAIERELIAALEEAISNANAQRVSQINELFAQDLRDPELVKLEVRVEEEKPKVFVIDPQTGDIHVSVYFQELLDSTTAVQQMEEQIIKRNRTFLEEGSIMYWTDVLGQRLIDYNDSIQISRASLREEVGKELDTLGIRSDFHLVLEHDSLAAIPDTSAFFQNQQLPALVDGHNLASVQLKRPGGEVLRRAGLVLLLTLTILLLMAAGVWLLFQMTQREARLSKLKDDFIDNVTHELLTPIATLKLALASLQDDDKLSQPNKYLDMSQQQAQRIADVVDHVLQVSFLDEERAGIRLEKVSPKSALLDVIKYYENSPNTTIQVMTGPEILIETDAHHLQNVFHNLIGNAIKYGPEKPRLDIQIQELPSTVKIAFTDNGPGIPAEEQKSIFEKFHRISEGDTHNVKGLGIGLYYARGILRQLGGDLVLSRSDASGSTFTVTLPKLHLKP